MMFTLDVVVDDHLRHQDPRESDVLRRSGGAERRKVACSSAPSIGTGISYTAYCHLRFPYAGGVGVVITAGSANG